MGLLRKLSDTAFEDMRLTKQVLSVVFHNYIEEIQCLSSCLTLEVLLSAVPT